jgi:2-C-methyl-D-erythritol 4-phosphate cytidylyltransferase
MGLFSFLFKRAAKKLIVPERVRCGAVVAAAGRSERMRGEDKLFAPLLGLPVLEYTLRALDACPDIDEITVAASEENILAVGDIVHNAGLTKITKIVRGGETRLDSVMAAMAELTPACGLVAIHDGARPLASIELISGVIRAAAACGAAAPAVAPKDTVKEAPDGMVRRTVPRDTLRLVQTPQVFDAALIKAALYKAKQQHLRITDDCSAVEAMGMPVRLTQGSYENIKLTTPEDLLIAEALMRRRMADSEI